jgi:hypothetical protein
MKYQELLELVKVGEGYTLEFKESINTSTLGKIKIPKQFRSKSEAEAKLKKQKKRCWEQHLV